MNDNGPLGVRTKQCLHYPVRLSASEIFLPSDISLIRKANLVGGLWMVLSMAGFAIEDAFIKAASHSLAISQILVLFGLGGAIVFGILARAKGEPLYCAAVLSPAMRLRAVFEIIGRLFYILAVTLTPLSSATVILQATPLVVVAGAALFMGEHVGVRRWIAILVGLIGVVVILRPDGDSFSLLSTLAVVGMLGFAGRDLASRAAPASLTASILGFYGFLSIIVAGAIYAVWENAQFVWPDIWAWSMLVGAVAAGVFAYTGLMKAMRMGEVAAVTPFRYTRLLFGVGFGVIFFGEPISMNTMFGAVLVVLSGLFIVWRGKSVAD